jgi:hypothetical protein
MTLREGEIRLQRRPHTKPPETKAQRNRRLAKAKAERLRLRERLAEDPDAVFSFREWCAVNSFSERQGRSILASGDGPVVTRISERRIGVSRRNNREWQERCAERRGAKGAAADA